MSDKKAKPNGAYPAFPVPAHQFLVEVEKDEIGTFWEVSGLGVTIETIPVKEGGQNQYEHKLPGRMTWPNLVLKRGVTRSDKLIPWLLEASGEGFFKKKNKLKRSWIAIHLTDAQGEVLRTWEFQDAFPVRWSGPSFSINGGSDVATEELEIAHNGFRVD